MRVAGRLVRLLHERGVAHPDLNLKNVLLAAEPGAAEPGAGGVRPAAWPADEPFPLVLDLDRASVGDPLPAARRRAMLERFWRSARKWERRTGRHLEPGLAEAFRAGYDEGWPGPAD